jgi:hypothetical protein
MAIFLLVFLYLIGPTFFFRSWMNVMFGFSFFLSKKAPTDLTSRELLVFSSVALLMYWLGISWQALVV